MQLFLIKIYFLATILLSDFYSLRIQTINGADKPLSVFRGKKVLIVVLPSTKTSEDSAFLRAINAVSKTYSLKLSVIAVPSFEDGYQASKSNDLRGFYNNLLGQQVTITEGMFTHKSSPTQHELFNFLTYAEKNIHFDIDVEGPGEKFLIDEQGQLFAVISPKTNLTEKIMLKILQ